MASQRRQWSTVPVPGGVVAGCCAEDCVLPGVNGWIPWKLLGWGPGVLGGNVCGGETGVSRTPVVDDNAGAGAGAKSGSSMGLGITKGGGPAG